MFKNVDLETDSYCGIALDVTFLVQSEMVYQGNVMNYTVSDQQVFSVRNSVLNSQNLDADQKDQGQKKHVL
jgi:hypothetical protein